MITNYANDGVATKVYTELEGFVDQFKRMGEGGQLERLCTTPKRFHGTNIGQSPEDFTERTLVEPILRALGYYDRNAATDDAEGAYFRRRPSTFSNVEPKRPDYLLENVDDSMTCLLEVKAINREQQEGKREAATEDVEKYLEDNTFCKYIHDTEHTFLLGIATDGFRWTHSVKNLDTGTVSSPESKVDISPVIASIAREHDVIRGEPDLGWKESVTFLANELVERYGADNLAGTVAAP